MKISLLKDTFDTHPFLTEVSWPIDFGDPQIVEEKKHIRAFSPCEFDGGGKFLANAIQAHLSVFDVDHASELDMADIVNRCSSKDLAFMIYTSFNHNPPDDHRFRVLVQTDRPIGRDEYALFWQKANNKLMGGRGDPACKDISRIYYLPAHRPGGTCEVLDFEGSPLSVDWVLSLPDAAEKPIELEDIKELAAEMKRAKSEFKKELSKTMTKALKGLAFANQGERDTTCFKLACVLAERWPTQDAGHLASFFAVAMGAMAAQGSKMDLDGLIAKIERQQGDEQNKIAEEKRIELEERQKKIKIAFRGKRSHPYSDAELAAFGDLDNKWIVRKGDSFYFFLDGAYTGPFQKTEMRNATQIELAASPLEMTEPDEKGNERFLSTDELVDRYGTVALNVAVDLRAQKSWYDADDRVIYEAPCPLRDLEPVFDPVIDEWLESLGGQQLKEWVGFCANVGHPLVALYIEGAPQSGKSLLAQGLSRLWTVNGPTDLSHAMGHFNGDILQCPLALADEDVPAVIKKEKSTGALRDFIQKRTRPLSRKFLNNSQMLGCTRLILAANNKDLITTNENLTQNDIAAIASRFLYVHAGFESRDFLEKIGGASFINKHWIEGDAIAKHALYLRENIPPADGRGRFYIETDVSALTQALTSSSGFRGEICNWLFSYLKDPRQMESKGSMGCEICVQKGNLYVGTKTLIDFWDVYLKTRPPQKVDYLVKSLGGLGRKDEIYIEGADKPSRVWRIDIPTLDLWAQDANMGSVLELLGRGVVKECENEDGDLPF